IKTSCLAKAAVVAADEKESGERALLNLGHTFAHAFEAEMGYGDDLLHGEAVAMGMIMAFDLSVRMGLCPAADAQRVRAHLAAAGLRIAPPTRGPHGVITAARLIAHMAGDKKTQDGVTTFVLARRIGDAFLSRDVRAEDLTAVLTDALSATR
ncbi:MAG: 3-dehydroquinate synthase, partial [Rhodobacteraceae bacterium]|nr:3-dehydroquinate synthase [Paracoccaceae bacterium]